MKNGIKAFVIIGIFALIATASLFISNYLERIPDNPATLTGNTSGNLNNKGLFAESDGRVYFSNSFHNGYLYSMNPDESDIKLVASSPAQNILVGGDYIYYYMDSSNNSGTGLGYVIRNFGIYRSSTKGKRATCLDREAAVSMQLIGNDIYFQRYNNKDFTKFYRVKTDKSQMEKISDEMINPVCADNGFIYFNGTGKDHYLYSFDTRTGLISTVYEGNLWYPQYQNGYVYYMDVANNLRLCRYNLSSKEVEILTNDRVDTYNVGPYNIYYQKNDSKDPALMRMNLDGSNPEIVASGIYSNINLTSEYAYFSLFSDPTNTFHTPIYGAINVSLFEKANAAVSK